MQFFSAYDFTKQFQVLIHCIMLINRNRTYESCLLCCDLIAQKSIHQSHTTLSFNFKCVFARSMQFNQFINFKCLSSTYADKIDINVYSFTIKAYNLLIQKSLILSKTGNALWFKISFIDTQQLTLFITVLLITSNIHQSIDIEFFSYTTQEEGINFRNPMLY